MDWIGFPEFVHSNRAMKWLNVRKSFGVSWANEWMNEWKNEGMYVCKHTFSFQSAFSWEHRKHRSGWIQNEINSAHKPNVIETKLWSTTEIEKKQTENLYIKLFEWRRKRTKIARFVLYKRKQRTHTSTATAIAIAIAAELRLKDSNEKHNSWKLYFPFILCHSRFFLALSFSHSLYFCELGDCSNANISNKPCCCYFRFATHLLLAMAVENFHWMREILIKRTNGIAWANPHTHSHISNRIGLYANSTDIVYLMKRCLKNVRSNILMLW